MDVHTLDYILNKYGLDPKSPMPITVPNMSRGALAHLFGELGFKKGVEIGVQTGKFSRYLCDANPGMEFYGIDPWLEYPEIPIPGRQEDQDSLYERAKATVPSNCTLIREKSTEAVHRFPDGYFDFVYIDGNHEFYSVADDLYWWSRKTRVGGIIAGHDYRRYYPSSVIHVYHVVNAYTEAYKIRPWFVTDHAAEKVRSFFWIKT